jgi:tetratricopeptide (TPR) repeat protein
MIWRVRTAGPTIAAVAIIAAGLWAYGNSFAGPFVLDDLSSIRDNPTIRHLWPMTGPLAPPHGEGWTVEGRPLLNLSFAVNYALSGLNVGSYHGLNLAIHLLAALALFGVVRRTLAGLNPAADPLGGAGGVAFAAALIWTVHPLQTEAVSYVVQRAESLMALCYLFTLYAFIRSVPGPSRMAWTAAAVAACAAGMATKEVMVSAPVIVFAYDRAFVAGSWREAWRARRWTYGALGSTWLLLGVLALGAGNRGGTSGMGSGVDAWSYWATQPAAVARYLRLCYWPTGQVFDYGTEGLNSPRADLTAWFLVAAIVGLSVGASLGGDRRRLRWGFLGLMFLAVLAPTSLVPGNRQTLAEHRMYLASAPVIVGSVLAGVALLNWALPLGLAGITRRLVPALKRQRRDPIVTRGVYEVGFWLVVATSVVALARLTRSRNADYRTAVSLFATDVRRRPENPYARANLGMALFAEGRPEAALGPLRDALRLKPVYPVAEDDLGNVLLRLGHPDEAEACYRRAIAEDRHWAVPHNNLGRALLQEGDLAAAKVELTAALERDPTLTEARVNWAGLLARSGLAAEAEAEYRAILAAQPDQAGAHNDLGILLAHQGDWRRAAAEYRSATSTNPALPEAHANLADALAALGQYPEAVAEYRRALGLRADFTPARDNLGNTLAGEGRLVEAVAEYRTALRFDPAHAVTHYNLANALLRLNRRDDAIREYREALRLKPDLRFARAVLDRLGVPP